MYKESFVKQGIEHKVEIFIIYMVHMSDCIDENSDRTSFATSCPFSIILYKWGEFAWKVSTKPINSVGESFTTSYPFFIILYKWGECAGKYSPITCKNKHGNDTVKCKSSMSKMTFLNAF